MVTYQTIATQLAHTLIRLSQEIPRGFTGIGLIVYKKPFLDESRIINLRPAYSPPHNLYLGTDLLHSYLSEISHKDHSLHDGYVLVDQRGALTHAAQFVQPPLHEDICPHDRLGTRYLSSLLVSKLESVMAVGNISSKGKPMLFQNGECTSLDEIEPEELLHQHQLSL